MFKSLFKRKREKALQTNTEEKDAIEGGLGNSILEFLLHCCPAACMLAQVVCKPTSSLTSLNLIDIAPTNRKFFLHLYLPKSTSYQKTHSRSAFQSLQIVLLTDHIFCGKKSLRTHTTICAITAFFLVGCGAVLGFVYLLKFSREDKQPYLAQPGLQCLLPHFALLWTTVW